MADQLNALDQVIIPDLWQQQAVTALREGRDVVVQAPTGSGKTLIFELWSNGGKNREQAVYTVPTRALANDKLAEWRRRGWNVGIATGDLAENLDAPMLVATLETQKNRLIRGEGPALLVVDEYQMLGDPNRGLNYELAIALAPSQTRLLMLSGSVANPRHIVQWLQRLGREAVVIEHGERPVPLEEVHAGSLKFNMPREVTGYWPRLAAKVLAEDLGPLLIFAPQRRMAEKLANELARKLPNPNPLPLSAEQKKLVGDSMARLLKCRVAYHHSGLSYATRAGVVEPLAKAGQLRVVVATMGLAAGINFSLRSVTLAGSSYRRDYVEQPLQADEILQMFGRAGRRGIDERGYAIVSNTQVRMHEGYPVQLTRSGMVDWPALLGIMHAAAEAGQDPYARAVQVQQRLFVTKPIILGVEHSLEHPEGVCGLMTDAERARWVRRRLKEIRNSRGEWEKRPPLTMMPAGEVFVCGEPGDRQGIPRLKPLLTQAKALENAGFDSLAETGEEIRSHCVLGRRINVAQWVGEDRIALSKWTRRFLRWKGRHVTPVRWEEKVLPLMRRKLEEAATPVIRLERENEWIQVIADLRWLPVKAVVDAHGVALWKPPARSVMSEECFRCPMVPECRKLSTRGGVAMTWRRFGLVEADGSPTRRGRVVSCFSQGVGLAMAAALEDESYALEELIYDLANLDGGFRFCGDDNRWEGRLVYACRQICGFQTIEGYLENGAPPNYGAGAAEIVRSLHQHTGAKHEWVSELLGAGDIDRAIIEWRSLLRQLAHAPDLDWARWMDLKQLAAKTLDETQSPTWVELPPLNYSQSRRVDHRLKLRRF